MKNKLYKHHKRKVFFIFRNFTFAFVGLLGIGLSIAIPTYISSQQETTFKAKAAEKKPADENTNNVENEELLSIR